MFVAGSCAVNLLFYYLRYYIETDHSVHQSTLDITTNQNRLKTPTRAIQVLVVPDVYPRSSHRQRASGK